MNNKSTNTPIINNQPSRENSGFTWSTVIKIIDPKTGQVLLHTRGE